MWDTFPNALRKKHGMPREIRKREPKWAIPPGSLDPFLLYFSVVLFVK